VRQTSPIKEILLDSTGRATRDEGKADNDKVADMLGVKVRGAVIVCVVVLEYEAGIVTEAGTGEVVTVDVADVVDGGARRQAR
jgi:hypothetical protein